jgi:serine/threonine-protein kinase
MAPEQAMAEPDLDHRVDVWALGVILYECLSGIRPIDGESVGQVVMRLMSTGITPLERVALGLPEDVTALVGRMLARERSRRPGDLREVAGVLARYTDVVVPEFGAPESEIDAAATLDDGHFAAEGASSTRARPRWPYAALAALLLLGLGVWWTRGSPSSPGETRSALPAPSPTPVAITTSPPRAHEPSATPATPATASARTAPKPAKPRAPPAPTTEAAAHATPPPPSLDAGARAPIGLAETPPF